MADKNLGPVVDLSWIFGGPIEAVVQANIFAAQQFVDFLKREGFSGNGDPSGVLGALQMVTLSFEQPGASGLPVKRLLRVPKLSLVPLPLLEVKDATFEFGVRVLSPFVPDTSDPHRRFRSVRLLKDDPPSSDDSSVQWHAMLVTGRAGEDSSAKSSVTPQLAANLNAKVTVGQADIPAGIRNLLAIMGENALLTPALLTVQPPQLVLGELASQKITLTALADTPRASRSPMIVAFYDATVASLSISDVPWPSGEKRHSDDEGRLEVEVRLLDVSRSDSFKILFSTEVADTSAVAELSCIIRTARTGAS